MFDPYRKWLGIPAEEQPPNHYRLLGIGLFENDQDVIKSAVVQRSAYVRNFQAGKQAEDATRILNEIGAADACLTNPAKRGPYDAELKRKIAQRKAAEAAKAQPPPAPRPLLDPALEQWAAAPALPNWAQMAPRQKSWATWQVAAIGGGGVVVVLLAVVVIMQMVGGDEPQPVAAVAPVEEAGETADSPATVEGDNAAPIQSVDSPPAVEDTSPAADVPAHPAEEAAAATVVEEPPPAPPPEVYLDSLQPFGILAMDPETGVMIFDGGDEYRRLYTSFWAGSAAGQHPISAIPPRPGLISSHLAYSLDGGFQRFLGAAGVSDRHKTIDSVTPLTFRIVGDGGELWKSAPLQKSGSNEAFDVDVSGVRTLHLVTDCPGTNDAAWSVWIAPRLVPADGESAAPPTPAETLNAAGAFLTDLRPQDIVANDPFTAVPLTADDAANGALFNIRWAGSHPAERAIWAAPLPNKISSHVAFRLRRGCERFTGRAAMSDLTAGGATAVTFRILGNGRELWRSKPLKDRGATEDFDVDVSGVDKLELQVDCPGSEFGAWAVWLDPRVTPPPSPIPLDPIDVLALVDPVRDAVQGKWRLEGNVLLSPGNPKHADRLQLTADVPPDYRLDLTVARVRGSGALQLTLPVATSMGYCCFDQYDGKGTGLGLIDGKDILENETAHRQRVFPGNKALDISITVRGSRVQVAVDGAEIVDWAGDPARLSLVPAWAGRDVRSLTIGVDNSSFRFTRIVLTPLASEGAVAEVD